MYWTAMWLAIKDGLRAYIGKALLLIVGIIMIYILADSETIIVWTKPETGSVFVRHQTLP